MRFLLNLCWFIRISSSLAIILTVLPAEKSRAEPSSGFFNITLENDVFANTDKNYTNGFRLAYTSTAQQGPNNSHCQIARNFLDRGGSPCTKENSNVLYGLALGHSIFTPENIEEIKPLPGQHPYAGWLYGEYSVVALKALATPALGDREFQRRDVRSVGIQLGIVGPSALGEEVQNAVHRRLPGVPIARGWHNQLHDEFGFALLYDRRWQAIYGILDRTNAFGFDIVPHYGLSLGNVLTQASFGLGFRIGTDLGNTDLPARVRPALPGAGLFDAATPMSCFVFADLTGRAVAQNIFLDGNTFRNSLRVNKHPFVADLQVGIGLRLHGALLSYTYVTRTDEFSTQDQDQRFGSVNLSFRY
ncbi:MAG: lipid A deacylase LpxR family protein [Hyphomicrobiaceae bacterium]